MIAATARSGAAKVTSIALIAGTSSVLLSKPVYNDEAPSSSSSSSSSSPSKLPIYPLPDPKVELVPVQTELERQISSLRRTVSSLTSETRSSVRSLVSSWIQVEHSIENEVKTLIPASEPLTPGLLYVGIATLASSIFTRYRVLPIRILTPPLAAIVSLHFFNPHLAANLGGYYTDLEQKYAPALTEQRRNLQAQAKRAVDSTTKTIHEVKDKTEQGVRSGLESVEQQTGLKVGDVVLAKENAKAALKDQMKAV